MSGRASGLVVVLVSLLLAVNTGTPAQTISGVLFHDRDGDGVLDEGEEALSGVGVRLYGQPDAGGSFDQTVSSAADGSFVLAPGNGCYLLAIDDPPGWRRSFARTDARAEGSPGYVEPVGLRRFGGAPELLGNLLTGTVRYTALGDSIAWNWNSCFDSSSFWYSQQLRDRLRCVAPSAIVDLDEAAIKGEHTDDLLIDDGGELNNVFRVIDIQPELVTISMIGNDLLGVEPGASPTQEEINTAVREVIDARANLQEVLSSLVSEIPHATIELNTLYDNLAWNCMSSNSEPFHNEWLPIVARLLRDVAWGQARRVTNAEVYLEFAHENLLDVCNGFTDQICHFLGDDIHPRHSGYEIIREKLWEALDGVNLGPKDGAGAVNISSADHGYLERVIRLLPTASEARDGAQLTGAEAAYDDDDAGLAATIRLGINAEEVRFSGFPGWYDEVVPVKVIAGIRFKTFGSVTDDFYRVEASRNGTFRAPPGHAFSPTSWDFYTPIVGSGGPNQPNPGDFPSVEVLAVPNVAGIRTASATLTKDPVLRPDGSGYDWPPLTLNELAATVIRVAAAPVASTPGD
ncbi:MAG: hypothetical protein JSV80_14130, partial [Acidobacteriota bacterium]